MTSTALYPCGYPWSDCAFFAPPKPKTKKKENQNLDWKPLKINRKNKRKNSLFLFEKFVDFFRQIWQKLGVCFLLWSVLLFLLVRLRCFHWFNRSAHEKPWIEAQSINRQTDWLNKTRNIPDVCLNFRIYVNVLMIAFFLQLNVDLSKLNHSQHMCVHIYSRIETAFNSNHLSCVCQEYTWGKTDEWKQNRERQREKEREK